MPKGKKASAPQEGWGDEYVDPDEQQIQQTRTSKPKGGKGRAQGGGGSTRPSENGDDDDTEQTRNTSTEGRNRGAAKGPSRRGSESGDEAEYDRVSKRTGRKKGRGNSSSGSDTEGNEDRCQKCGSGTHTTKECKSQLGGKKNDPKRTLKCFICGKRGHTRDECSSGLEPGQVKFKGKGKGGLKVERGQKVRNEDAKPPETLPVSSVPYMDPCVFLHRCFARAHHFGSVEAFSTQYPSCMPAECEGAIAVFADKLCLERTSDRYRCWETILQDERVWGVFGCLPQDTSALQDVVEERLEEWIDALATKVVGLVGGLHFTKECTDEDKHVQKSVLKNIVTLAKRLQKPIMLFCVEAERDMLQVLESCGVQPDHLIHLAQFEGDNDFLVLQLMRTYPNLHVSFDGRVTFGKAGALRRLLFEVPLERLILQTSAPDFIPSTLPGTAASQDAFSHPGMLPAVAIQVSEILKRPSSELLEAVRNNIHRIYGV